MTVSRRFGLLIWLLAGLVAVKPYRSAAAADAKPGVPGSGAVLPTAARPSAVLIAPAIPDTATSHELAADLQKEGFTVNLLGGWPGLEGQAITWDQIKPYNVIVLTANLGLANPDGSLSDTAKSNIALLNRFLNAGGGIFFICLSDSISPPGTLPQTAFLKPLGLTPIFDEVLFDPETSVNATAWKIDFAHTENIGKDSPLTAGVTSLWYPSASRMIGGQNHSVTFVPDTNWTVAVRGSRTAISGRGQSATDPAGHYASAPPLVASRTVGKGRIVFCGIAPQYLVGEAGMNSLERIVFDRGLKNVPSQGYLLLRNALRWLAEPSVTEGVLGGAPMDLKLLVDPAKTVFCPPFFDWKTASDLLTTPPFPALAGVIGARSTASSGRGTAAEWVKQAKTQGLAYLVFLEEFAKLPKDKYEELKKECARLTTPEFTAIPGFTIDDEIGNHYFYFGPNVAYPDRKFLSKDGTVFVSYDPQIDAQNPHVKGQLSMTPLLYVVSEGGFKMTAGNYLFSQDAAPFANFFCNWDATGIITARDGQVLEDATKDYLGLVDFGLGPLPLAINLMTDPAKLAQCRWKTVLRLDPRESNQIAAYWGDWHFYPNSPTRIYITSGPEIVRWYNLSHGAYVAENRGDFVWENLRWKAYGEVQSAVGLKEVAVYDGPELFRRFLPKGQKEFAFTLDLTHNQQHNLVLIATDMNGDRAVSGEQWDFNARLSEVHCSDRNNQIATGDSTQTNGIGFHIADFQVTPNHRVDNKQVQPSAAFKYDARLGVSAFDGAPYGEPLVRATMDLRVGDDVIQSPTVSESFRLLHSGDVHIGEGRWENNFTDNIGVANVYHTLWKTEPAKDFVVTKRNTFFNVDPDSPLAVFLWTIKATLKRDLPNNGLTVGFVDGYESKFWALRGSDQTFLAGYWKADDRTSSHRLRVPFGQGAYAAELDSPLGGAAVFSLTDGMEMSMAVPPDAHRRIYFELPAGQTPQKKDETREVSLLLLGIPRAADSTREIAAPNTETVERFRRDFGLDGGKTGYAVELKEGTLLGQRYILDVDGQKSGCFSGTLEGNLISSLPIRVAGLQDRWSAFLYDRTLKKARPLGVFENKTWAMAKLHGRLDLFIGHPILCDKPELFIQVTQSGENAWSVEIHNPTDAAVRTTLRKNPAFDPFAAKELKDAELEIPAGQSIVRSL